MTVLDYAKKAKERIDFDFPYELSDWIENKNMLMENYHKHTTWSDLVQIDSATSMEEFIEYSKNYGCRNYFSGEHGYQGEWLAAYDLCTQMNINFRYSVEAYWVKNIEEKDNTNCHMVIVARNYKAMRKLNYMISVAHQDGFYYKPRIDLKMLFELDKDDVYITSACIAGWKYEDATEIWYKVAQHFGDSFFLEYQTNNTEEQKKINRIIYELSQSAGIKTIIGLDTHYLNEEDRIKRDNLLKRKGIRYPGEAGWYMDFPTGTEVFRRMCEQGVIPPEEIVYAMMNTHTFNDGCEELKYNSGFKIPILEKYKGKSYEERSKILLELLTEKYEAEDDEHRTEDRKAGMLYEYSEIDGSGTADYFLDNYELIELAVNKYGGHITTTSRGSASSYYSSKLLGFTTMDRFESEVPIYPERFVTKDRILSSHQMPDIDINCQSQEAFVLAGKELCGEYGCYPLLAVGRLKEKNGFKLYAGVNGIEPSVANEITKCIDRYNEALKNAEDDEKDLIDIEDYITDRHHLKLFNESKSYQEIIEQAKVHACFLEGQLVHTSEGYKNIEDIRIGDFVLTHNNRFSQVIKTIKTSAEKIVELTITGEKIRCTPNHPFYAKKRNETPEWVDAEKLTKEHYVAYPIDNSSIIPTFYQEAKTYKSRYIDLNDKNMWWLIGRYMGDGWCENPRPNYHKVVICCSKVNDDELDEIISHIPSYLKYKVEKARTTYKINFYHKALYGYLQQFGKYAYGKKITSDIMNLPEDYLKEFLKGYISADGHTDYSAGYGVTTFRTVSKELCYGLQYCIHKAYRVPCTISISEEKDEFIEGRLVHSRRKYTGRFSLTCKKNRINFYEDGFIWIKVRNSELLYGAYDTYNMSVVGDNSYTVANAAVHNCGHVLFNGVPGEEDVPGYGDIRYEIGLIRCHSESTGKTTIVANIEGSLLDKYGYVKDDFLIVDVVGIIHKLYAAIGREVPTVTELRKMVSNDEKTWRMYEIGATCCLNQCEKASTTKKVMKFKPKNIKELAAFIAGIRPGFKSLLGGFLDRIDYTNGEPAIDELLEDCFHYMLYQEAVMKIFSWLGIEMKDSYDTIKKISKKKLKGAALQHVEDTLREHWLKNIGNLDNFEPVYKVIKDSARYSFNAPHALAMANDSLYEAWMKAHYPSVFYEVTLNHYQGKGDKNKVADLTREAMSIFGYKMGTYKYGKDNTKFTVDDKEKIIYPNLSSVKSIGDKAVEAMMEISRTKRTDIIDIYAATKGTKINSTVFTKLVKINYFEEYGSIKYLLACLKIYDKWNGRKTISKSDIPQLGLQKVNLRRYATDLTPKGNVAKRWTIFDEIGLIKDICSRLPRDEFPSYVIAQFQYEVLGYIDFKDETLNDGYRTVCVTNLDTKYSPRFEAYCIKNGKTSEMKIHKKNNFRDKRCKVSFQDLEVKDGDIIFIKDCKKEQKRRKTENGWEDIPDSYDWWVKDYSVISCVELVKEAV